MSDYFYAIGEGAGEKTGQLISSIASIISGFAVSYIFAPWLAIPVTCYLPFQMCMVKNFGKRLHLATIEKMKETHKLGGFTEEVLSAIKVVVSFGQETTSVQKY